ncbi:hypothetical protein [Pyxidicoccus trucidator]|uniref:hypothetical protein n=1 Tax=Pyxidicoccus trucidator TaxID=2709662 RepID=UPI0013D9169E|nr:hypothetical protein [Pyxidicoccus trucidator]
MARAAGGDVVVQFLGEVAELRKELRGAQTDVRFLSSSLGSAIAQLACMRVAMDSMKSTLESVQQRLGALEDKH